MDPVYLSNRRPDFTPFERDCGTIVGYRYQGALRGELDAGRLTPRQAVDLLEDMLIIREFEEMIVKLRSVGYPPLPKYDYRGPTHVSIGQEATSVGACAALGLQDHITSTHRGHGDSVARGCAVIRGMTEAELRRRVHAARSTHAVLARVDEFFQPLASAATGLPCGAFSAAATDVPKVQSDGQPG
jgi:2-oxoisovalerate dehydrogenase E1 component